MVNTDRVALGIDVTVKVLSLARVTEGKSPICLPVTSPDAGTSHSVASTLHRTHGTIRRVMEVVMKRPPTIAVMVKSQWGDMKADPSCARRMGLWTLLADALVAEGIPVAEVPMLTLSTFMGSAPVPGKKGADALTAAVSELYPALGNPGQGYRLGSTVAAALAGAMAAGVDTLVPLTSERLQKLQGNAGVQWPMNLKPPASLGEWARRNNHEDSPATLAG